MQSGKKWLKVRNMTASKMKTKSTVIRGAKRANYDAEVIHQILDSHFLCHLGVVVDGEAVVIPTAYVRIGEAVYLHGHLHNRALSAASNGQTVCISVTHIDGLVLARSAFHHSVNYRSVIAYGNGEVLEGEEKSAALDALIEHYVPGRLSSLRPGNEKEWQATQVVKINISEASAKIRSGPPVDTDADYELPIWAGEIPLKTVATVKPCPKNLPTVDVPAHVTDFVTNYIKC